MEKRSFHAKRIRQTNLPSESATRSHRKSWRLHYTARTATLTELKASKKGTKKFIGGIHKILTTFAALKKEVRWDY